MAEHVRPARERLLGSVLTAALLAASGAGGAQVLADPTRPPAALSTPGQGTEGAPASGPVLQSILISPTRREAIVDGRTVRVGDRIGEARVASIAEGRLVLRTGGSVQILRLFPELRKQPNPDPARARAGEQRK